jgi:O-antigen biosynthesis protein
MTEPRFSLITPVYRPPRKALRAMLDSVRAQGFGDWEHIVVDDCSEDPKLRSILEQAAADEPRLRVAYRDQNGGIVAATNDALKMATGEYVAFLDNDDELAPTALAAMAAAIDADPGVDCLYSDQDLINKRGRHYDPFVKPAWSPERLAAQMYIAHFRVLRRALVEELGGLRPGFDGAQDWDLALRLAERTDRVVHVPGLLYHWRALKTSAAGAPEAKPWAHEASRRAVAEHVELRRIQATVEPIPNFPGHYWLRPALTERPLVSIVIPTAGSPREQGGVPLVLECVRSVVERSTYEEYELVVVIDAAASDEVRERLREIGGERLQLIEYDAPFNFSAKVNLGVQRSRGEQILLLNDDVEVLPPGWRPARNGNAGGLPEWDTLSEDGRRIWIESMLAYAIQNGVGAVGAKLYLPDGRLQHGGVIAKGGLIGHPYYLKPGDEPGYMGCLMMAGNFLAVTAACLMTSRRAFEAVGGFDTELPLNYNDVDYCLKLRAAGLRSVMVPHAELLHHESVSRGPEPPLTSEIEAMQERWGELLHNDPYYGPEFLDSNYTLPMLTRGGVLRERGGIFPYVGRARMLYREGGLGFLAGRTFRKLGRHIRRPLGANRR